MLVAFIIITASFSIYLGVKYKAMIYVVSGFSLICLEVGLITVADNIVKLIFKEEEAKEADNQ